MMRGTPQDCIAWLLDADPGKLYELKEARPQRTLTQNAYYWAMLNRLARTLGVPDSELHLNMLREYGVCEVVSFAMHVPPEAVRGYLGDYYDELGVNEGVTPSRREFKVYKGSSKMTRAEFKRLIDGMREECEAQGIDVMTPAEVAALAFAGEEGERNY